jgi:hypothetical protein
MIKQFKILESRTEADGTTGVIYQVWRVTSTGLGTTETKSLTGYMQVPDGIAPDEYLFQELSKVGWF